MLRQDVSLKLGTILNVVSIVSSFFVALIGGFLKVEPKEYEGWQFIQTILTRTQKSAWWTIPTLTIVAALAQFIKSRIGSSSKWRTVQYLLDQYKDAIFEKHATAKDDPEHFHRVTLFKHVKWRWGVCRWPWTEWMVPVARSGHTTHSRHIRRFRAPANYPDEAEGVAGQVWVQKKAIPVYNLPILSLNTSPQDLETYARRVFLSVEWLEKRKDRPSARSLLGIPLEVKGQVWGALVVDSRSPNDISSKKVLNSPLFRNLSGFLAKLLEP
jgi:hypothetical protein